MSGAPSQELSVDQVRELEEFIKAKGISINALASWAIKNSAGQEHVKLSAIREELKSNLSGHNDQKLNGGRSASDIMVSLSILPKPALPDKEVEAREVSLLGCYVKQINKICTDFKDADKGGLADLIKAVRFYESYAVIDFARREAADRKEAKLFELNISEQLDKDELKREIEADEKIMEEKTAAIEKLKEGNKSLIDSFPGIVGHNLRKWVEYLEECEKLAKLRDGFFASSWVGYMANHLPNLRSIGKAHLSGLDSDIVQARNRNQQQILAQAAEAKKIYKQGFEMGSRTASRAATAGPSRMGADHSGFRAVPSRVGADGKSVVRDGGKGTKELQQLRNLLPQFFSPKTILVLNELAFVLGAATEYLPFPRLSVAISSPASQSSLFQPADPSAEFIEDAKGRELVMKIMGDLILEDGDQAKSSAAIAKCISILGENLQQGGPAFNSLYERLTQFQNSKNIPDISNGQEFSCPGCLTVPEIKALKADKQEELEKLKNHYAKVKFLSNLIGEKMTFRYLPVYDEHSSLAVRMRNLLSAFLSHPFKTQPANFKVAAR